jgi:hypothetical protein
LCPIFWLNCFAYAIKLAIKLSSIFAAFSMLHGTIQTYH